MTYIEKAATWLRDRFADPAAATANDLNLALRVLAIWRSSTLVAEFQRHHGLTILQGPFEGMAYVGAAAEGALLPRLIGTYEQELHPAIRGFAAADLDCVIDVGCAEGYYAVGMARLMPRATIYAHDINEKAQAACRELAGRNGVAERVVVGGIFAPEQFQAFAERKCLVICDIEGAEDDLLRPDLAPALAGMNLIVEVHEVYKPGLLARMIERFEPTHHVERLDMGPRTLPLPLWFFRKNHMDQLLAVWEWRSGPTPWLVLKPKTAP
ncbi:MAG TPA: class I SAM-dependent methyltransferase [Phenylobacterium sp.]|nr:class I SAM-dependent methyltransferase [Phenylobacterium sp.]